ncbi:MAG: NAD(P)H-hydrate dehydratase [Bacillota bacterium]
MGYPVYTPKTMKQLDQTTMERQSITSYALMERAAKRLFDAALNHALVDDDASILVLSGPGNNGGDATLLARHLFNRGHKVHVLSVGEATKGSDENKKALDHVSKTVPHSRIASRDDLSELPPLLKGADLIVDGLFGIGLSRHVTGVFHDIIDAVNLSGLKTISLDIPSGVNGKNGRIQGIAIHADATLVIGGYKSGNILADALDTHGETYLVDIGLEKDAVSTPYRFDLAAEFEKTIPRRRHNTHKYDYGQVFVIGGSPDMPGAPHLSGLAALRSGAGLVRLCVDEATKQASTPNVHELTYHTYRKPEALLERLKKVDAIVYGIGLGEIEGHEAFLKALLETKIPMVIDADGLKVLKNVLKGFDKTLEHVIIVPHAGEFSRLTDTAKDALMLDPFDAVSTLAKSTGMTVVLKGPATIVASGESVHLSQAKNPGLATAGSGDVLAGIAGSLLSRKVPPFYAARLAVAMHSLAARTALDETGEESLIASDIIAHLPRAIRQFKS